MTELTLGKPSSSRIALAETTYLYFFLLFFSRTSRGQSNVGATRTLHKSSACREGLVSEVVQFFVFHLLDVASWESEDQLRVLTDLLHQQAALFSESLVHGGARSDGGQLTAEDVRTEEPVLCLFVCSDKLELLFKMVVKFIPYSW